MFHFGSIFMKTFDYQLLNYYKLSFIHNNGNKTVHMSNWVYRLLANNFFFGDQMFGARINVDSAIRNH